MTHRSPALQSPAHPSLGHRPQLRAAHGLRRPNDGWLRDIDIDGQVLSLGGGVLTLGGAPFETVSEAEGLRLAEKLHAVITEGQQALAELLEAYWGGAGWPSTRRARAAWTAAGLIEELTASALKLTPLWATLSARTWRWPAPSEWRRPGYWDKELHLAAQHSRRQQHVNRLWLARHGSRPGARRAKAAPQVESGATLLASRPLSRAAFARLCAAELSGLTRPQGRVTFWTPPSVSIGGNSLSAAELNDERLARLIEKNGSAAVMGPREIYLRLLALSATLRENAFAGVAPERLAAINMGRTFSGAQLTAGIGGWARRSVLREAIWNQSDLSWLSSLPAGPEREARALTGREGHDFAAVAALHGQRPEELLDRELLRAVAEAEQMLDKGAHDTTICGTLAGQAAEHFTHVHYDLRSAESLPPRLLSAASAWRVGRRALIGEAERELRRDVLARCAEIRAMGAALQARGAQEARSDADKRAAYTQALTALEETESLTSLVIPGLVTHEALLRDWRAQLQEGRERISHELIRRFGLNEAQVEALVSDSVFPDEAAAPSDGAQAASETLSWDAELSLSLPTGPVHAQARVLRTSQALKRESAKMNHCIGYGGYTDRCASGRSVAVHVEGEGVCFTALLSLAERQGEVFWQEREARGPGNRALTDTEERLMAGYRRALGVREDARERAVRGAQVTRLPREINDIRPEWRAAAAELLAELPREEQGPLLRLQAAITAAEEREIRAEQQTLAARLRAEGAQPVVLDGRKKLSHQELKQIDRAEMIVSNGVVFTAPDLTHWDPDALTGVVYDTMMPGWSAALLGDHPVQISSYNLVESVRRITTAGSAVLPDTPAGILTSLRETHRAQLARALSAAG